MREWLRWDPLDEPGTLRGVLERLPRRAAGCTPAPWHPTAEVEETDDAFVLWAELPGVPDEDVEVRERMGLLRVHARRGPRPGPGGAGWLGDFECTFRLPRGVTGRDVRSRVAYGVLRVEIPKRPPC